MATLTWEDAWHEALYGSAGFYRRHAPADHFATSVQGVPGAGRLLAEALLALARRHRCTRVVDVGAGRGELLAALRTLDPDLALAGVDVVAAPPGLDADWITSPGGAELPATLRSLRDTLVVAHEWLDVVPAPVVERDDLGVWRVVTVAPDGTESLGPVLGGADLAGADLAWADRWLTEDVRRAEIGRPRDQAWADLVCRVDSGVVLAVDYGHTRADRPRHGTLTGFRAGREVDPVPDGSCDLTAHVAVDSLAAATPGLAPTVLTQAEALRDLLGDAPGRAPDPALARTRPTAYLEALARRGAFTALTAAGGLGGFRWVVATRG